MASRPSGDETSESESLLARSLGLPTFRRFGQRLARGLRWLRERRNGTPRPTTKLSREGLYYIAIILVVFVFALLGDMNLLIVLAGMLIGPLWANWRLVSKTLHGVEVRRRMPGNLCAGDSLVVDIEVTNTRKRRGSWAVVAQEQITREGAREPEPPLEPVLFFHYVGAAQSRSRVYRARLPRRGRYRFAPLTVSTRFPFGFCRHAIVVGGSQTLVVFPRLGRLMPRWLARHHEAFEGTRRREHRSGQMSGEFYGVRPWRSGDSRRFIHWRSSARHGDLVVRQFDQHRNRDAALVVDLWQPDRPSPEERENVELAVSFAATVVADTCRRAGGNLMAATTAPGDELVRGPASPILMQAVMEKLAVAEASSEDRLAEVLDGVLAAIEPGTEVVLVTTRETDLADARFAALAENPIWRSIAARVRVINTADEELSAYFQPE